MSDDLDLESAYALKTPEDNRRLYRAWAESYDNDFVDATDFRIPSLIAQAFPEAGGQWPCLDVGCGTGAVAEHMPRDAVVDGVDLSPEMLAVAARKSRYRHLFEANLKETLPFDDASYAGLVSSGTFTHGHVGGEALNELVRIMRSGGLAIFSIKPEIWDEMGFGAAFSRLTNAGMIGNLVTSEEQVYGDPAKAPDGHGDDLGRIVRFRRI